MTGIQISASPAGPAGSWVHGAHHWAVLGLLDTTAGQVAMFIVGWVGIGVVAALFLRMRGHEFRSYAALGAVMGPAFVFLAYDAMRHRESERPITISPTARSSGPPVLIVAVGELDDHDAALAAIDSVGDVGSVTAAVPVDYEVAERVHRMGNPPPESRELELLAETLDRFSPGLMMLPGRVEKSIAEGVRETGAELVLIVGGDSATVAPELENILETDVVRVEP